MLPSTPHSLEYAASHARGRRIRRAAAVFLVLLGLVAGGKWGRGVLDRAAVLYHQRRCMAYTAPPDQVVFDSNPQRVAVLARDPAYVIYKGCAFRKPPADWTAIFNRWPSRLIPSALVFLHARQAPGGSVQLVSLERDAGADESPRFIQGYDVSARVFDPASITRPLSERPNAWILDVVDSIGPHDIRIYAGQADPADSSHYTVRYEFNGKSQTIDGYLQNDGSTTLSHQDQQGQ